MSWSIHVPPGPCETFTERGTAAVANHHHLDDAQRAQATAAVAIAAQIVADELPGQQDTHYAANLHGHIGGGTATVGLSVTAAPVPA
jgi:hypothetical protein